MSKLHLFMMSLCAALCTQGVHAQCPRVLSLEDIYALAEERSKTLQTGQAALSEAQQAVREARTAYLPDVEVSLAASYLGNGTILKRDFSEVQEAKMPHFGNNFAIKATQLVYAGGAVTNGIAMARLKQEMAGAQLAATRSRVRFLLTGYYLDLYKLQNTLKVYDKNIELAQIVITDTKARNTAGVALQNDITRYELRLKNLELARKRVANAIDILNYDLVTTLGLPEDTRIQPDTMQFVQSAPACGLDYWQQMAKGQAHAVKLSAIEVEMGKCGEKIAKAERLPTVALTAANQLDGPITIEIPAINRNFNRWYVGVGITYKLSSLYKSNKSIRRAELNTELSRSRQNEVCEQTDLTIQADFTKYLESIDEVSTLEKNVQLARESYQVINNRYCNGIALVTDMLDAANAVLDAELQLANAHIQVIFNHYKLKHTAGDL